MIIDKVPHLDTSKNQRGFYEVLIHMFILGKNNDKLKYIQTSLSPLEFILYLIYSNHFAPTVLMNGTYLTQQFHSLHLLILLSIHQIQLHS